MYQRGKKARGERSEGKKSTGEEIQTVRRGTFSSCSPSRIRKVESSSYRKRPIESTLETRARGELVIECPE